MDSLKVHMNVAAASKHVDTQMQLYGRQVMVNLVRLFFSVYFAKSVTVVGH